MKAIYYYSQYYLLPEGFNDAETFSKSLTDGEKVTLEKLNEDGCIAPFFIKGRSETKTVTFEQTSQIFSADIELLDEAEYAERLKKLSEDYCDGCPKYKGLPYGEMSLDGMCYEDEEGLEDQLSDKVVAFWKVFEENERDYRDKIDREQFGDVKKAVEDSLSFLGTVYAALNRISGRYKLMFSGLFDQELSLLCSYLVSRAPEKLGEYWDFFPYLPQNVFKYRPEKGKINLFENAPLIKFVKKNADRPRFDVTLKIKGDQSTDAFLDNMLYVFSVMGENRFLAALSSVSCVPDQGENTDGSVHIRDFSAEVQKCYQEKLRAYFRRFNYVELKVTQDSCSGKRKYNQLVTTNCDSLTRILLTDAPEKLSGLKTDVGTVGTLTFDFGKSIMDYKSKLNPIHDQIEKALYEPGYIVPVGVCYGPTKVFVDFILADINRARKAIRALTPMLSAYSAVYTESSSSGSNSYICCYELGIKEA